MTSNCGSPAYWEAVIRQELEGPLVVLFSFSGESTDDIGHDAHFGMRFKAGVHKCPKLFHGVISFLSNAACKTIPTLLTTKASNPLSNEPLSNQQT